jgi:catechol 2,3-dioxygenase-like lactoylglutathione lyase family enzyme
MGIRLVQGGAVSLMVTDIERAIRFYGALGFTVREQRGDRCAELELPGLVLRLQRGGDPGWKRSGAFPCAIALQVERLEGAMLILRDRGVQFAPEVAEREGLRIAFFTDDDGTPLYLEEMKHTARREPPP